MWKRTAAARGRRRVLWIPALLVLATAAPTSAAPQLPRPSDAGGGTSNSRPSPIAPDQVTVPSRSLPEEREHVPAAVSTLDGDAVQKARQQLGLDEAFGKIPGLFVQNRYNFAQDLRISSRGFGARASFGVRGIKLYVDGIPATLPDGQTQVDGIDLGSVGRIEVMRGPASAAYGPAAGGVIQIRSDEIPEEPFAEGRVALGAFGFERFQVKAAGRAASLGALLSLSHVDWDGHRDHSAARLSLLNTRLELEPDDTWQISLILRAVDAPEAQDPGSLTRDQVRADREQASDRNRLFDAGESLDEQTLGLVLRKRLGPSVEVSARGYTLWRDFDNRLPFQDGGSVDLDRFVGGGGLQVAARHELWGRPQRWTLGLDVDAQRDRRRRFDNVFGTLGPLRLDQDEDVTALGLYAQSRVELARALELVAGARFDSVRFRVDDHFPGDGDDSGSRRFGEFSPSLGMIWQAAPLLSLYGNVSTSFETPTTTEFANPGGGGLNPDLDSARALSFEIGAKGLAPGRLRYDLALFRVRVKDELVPFELPGEPGRSFFRNAGRSTREGLELALAVEPVPGWVASLAYTYSDFRFDRHSTPAGVFDGNRIPGVPRHQGFMELAYRSPLGLEVAWEALYVDRVQANDANTERSGGYWVSSLRASQRFQMGHWVFEPFAGVNNLFDRDYDANVRINAFGARFFEPAPGRHVYGGLLVRYETGS